MNLTDVLDLLRNRLRGLEEHEAGVIKGVQARYAKEKAELTVALRVMEQMNTACTRCGGRGYIRVLDAAGDSESEPCPVCGGSKLASNGSA